MSDASTFLERIVFALEDAGVPYMPNVVDLLAGTTAGSAGISRARTSARSVTRRGSGVELEAK